MKLTEGTVVYSEIPIEWPRRVIVDADGDDSGSESNPVLRPDSGVGESVGESLNEESVLNFNENSLSRPNVSTKRRLWENSATQRRRCVCH